MNYVEDDKLSCDAGWAEQELGKADFGDRRLSNRLVRVAEDLSSRPQVLVFWFQVLFLLGMHNNVSAQVFHERMPNMLYAFRI